MRIKTIIGAAILALAPAVTWAMGCAGGHDQTADMSCPVGQMLDTETNACVPLVDVTS